VLAPYFIVRRFFWIDGTFLFVQSVFPFVCHGCNGNDTDFSFCETMFFCVLGCFC